MIRGKNNEKKFILLLIVLLLIFLITNSYHKRDFEFGTYESKKLVSKGLSSTFNIESPLEKNTGMEYIIDKSKFVIKYAYADKYSILPHSTKEYIFNNITYEKIKIMENPNYKISFLVSIFKDVESGVLYKIFDENHNKIDFEILLLNGELYIIDRVLFNVDMITLSD